MCYVLWCPLRRAPPGWRRRLGAPAARRVCCPLGREGRRSLPAGQSKVTGEATRSGRGDKLRGQDSQPGDGEVEPVRWVLGRLHPPVRCTKAVCIPKAAAARRSNCYYLLGGYFPKHPFRALARYRLVRHVCHSIPYTFLLDRCPSHRLWLLFKARQVTHSGLAFDATDRPDNRAAEEDDSSTGFENRGTSEGIRGRIRNQRGWPGHRPSEWSWPGPGAADEGLKETSAAPADARAFSARAGADLGWWSTKSATWWPSGRRQEVDYGVLPGGTPRGFPVQHTGNCGVVSRRPIRPAVARMVMASSIPRPAVAESGIV